MSLATSYLLLLFPWPQIFTCLTKEYIVLFTGIEVLMALFNNKVIDYNYSERGGVTSTYLRPVIANGVGKYIS